MKVWKLAVVFLSTMGALSIACFAILGGSLQKGGNATKGGEGDVANAFREEGGFVEEKAPEMEGLESEERMRTEETKEEEVESVPGREEEDSLDDVLTGFAETVYTYDTRERMFYTGCEQFMTEEAYQNMVPPSDGDEEGLDGTVEVTSKLVSMEHYGNIASEGRATVLMETVFTTVASGENEIYQIMKLQLEKVGGGWKITDCETICTIYR